ncbi:hypothetical protein F383_13626 [Gossypium arboreum]|uniref:Uncharacterized protein n=1 Tax=Gossypium arboreum TaxID=29729 RepID=A0A0B0NDI3_GOSAR|nr:hypothetical protein F383_13626 [Gossypium arboreum]
MWYKSVYPLIGTQLSTRAFLAQLSTWPSTRACGWPCDPI